MQGWRLNSLAGQSVPVDYPHSFSLHFKGISCVLICGHCVSSFHSISLRTVCLCHFYCPPYRFLYTLITSLLSLLVLILNSPSSFSLFWYDRCSNTLIIIVAHCWSLSSMSSSSLCWETKYYFLYCCALADSRLMAKQPQPIFPEHENPLTPQESKRVLPNSYGFALIELGL